MMTVIDDAMAAELRRRKLVHYRCSNLRQINLYAAREWLLERASKEFLPLLKEKLQAPFGECSSLLLTPLNSGEGVTSAVHRNAGQMRLEGQKGLNIAY